MYLLDLGDYEYISNEEFTGSSPGGVTIEIFFIQECNEKQDGGRDPFTQRSKTRVKVPPPSSEKCLRELGPLDRNRVHFWDRETIVRNTGSHVQRLTCTVFAIEEKSPSLLARNSYVLEWLTCHVKLETRCYISSSHVPCTVFFAWKPIEYFFVLYNNILNYTCIHIRMSYIHCTYRPCIHSK